MVGVLPEGRMPSMAASSRNALSSESRRRNATRCSARSTTGTTLVAGTFDGGEHAGFGLADEAAQLDREGDVEAGPVLGGGGGRRVERGAGRGRQAGGGHLAGAEAEA